MSVIRRFIRPRRLLPVIQFAFLSAGRPWREFYAWWLNRQDRFNTVEKIRSWRPDLEGYERGFWDLTRGQYHKEFMIRHGLEADHTLLDFGCGFGRTAIAIIPFLDKGKYIGIDISSERIRMAKQWVSEEGLSRKEPRFETSSDILIHYIEDNSVDFIWCQAVISHMPLSDVQLFLKAAYRILKPNGSLIFDYVVSEDGFKRHTIKDFFYTHKQIEQSVAEAGLKMELLHDWDDDIEPEQRVANEILVKAMKPEI